MIVPLPLLELKKCEDTTNEPNEKMKHLIEILENILPEYIGV